MYRILCLNGPNLDRLGSRQPEMYGRTTLGELERQVTEWGSGFGFEVVCRQSSSESEMVGLVGSADFDGLVVNPGALTHTSHALADAIRGIDAPAIEVHLSNIRARERWRRRSLVAPACILSIFGRGAEGYRSAMRALANRRHFTPSTHRYGPHVDQVFDLAGSGTRAVGLIHGGFWLDSWGRDTMETWTRALVGRGFLVANLEYRRMGSGGGPMATPADILAALATLRNERGVDQMTLIGHSAGAHLAIHSAVNSPGIERVVGLAGIYRLDPSLGDGAVGRYDPERATELENLADLPSVTLLHGDADREVPMSQSREFGRLTGSSFRAIPGAGHFDLLNPSPLLDEAFGPPAEPTGAS